MAIYSAKVIVEYYFDIDTNDYDLQSLEEVKTYAYDNFSDHPYSAEVYSVKVTLESEDEDED